MHSVHCSVVYTAFRPPLSLRPRQPPTTGLNFTLDNVLFSQYEGHPINKLLNGFILLIFKIWKSRNARFVGNLFLSTSFEFHFNDVIMMMSLVFWTQSVSAVFYPSVFFHNSRVLNSKKNEQIWQADLFDCQTLRFIFQHLCYSFKHSSHLWIQHERINCCDRCKTTWRPGRFFPVTLSPLRANFIHQYVLVVLLKNTLMDAFLSEWHWCLSPFAQRKWMTERRSLQDTFNGNITIFNGYNWRHHNKTYIIYSGINSLQIVYLAFFIF